MPPGAPSGAISIKDVSRVAGVSISTVSHVLNRTRYVSDEARERVERAIAELNYRHNGLARSLRTKQSYAMGLIIPDVSNPYYPQLARGVQDAAAAAGYWVFLCNSDRSPENEVRLLHALEERRVDGVILDAGGPDASLLETLHRAAVPVVLVGSRIDDTSLDVVTVAPNGGYDAVRHLLERGHRRIGLIAGPPVAGRGASGNASGGGRLAKAGGYLQALAEAGIPPEPALMVQGDYTREGGQTAMRRLLALDEPPSAVFAGNDLMAIGALHAARAAGRRVPEDVAIVGYDDIPEAEVTSPALTTISVPKYEMGRAAGELLLERITTRGGGDGREDTARAPRHVVLPYTLRVRETT